MLQIKIDTEVETLLAEIAAKVGKAPEELARRALLAYMEDLEDYAAAVEALREVDPSQCVSLETLMARYGVDG